MPVEIVANKDIFRSRPDALVCPVNAVGTMGKGIALEFKRRFPEIVRPYKWACRNGRLSAGHVMMVSLVVQPHLFEHRRPSIILFATKQHWMDPSSLKWIASGLRQLRDQYRRWNLRSVSMPQIGCGLGGLSWVDVLPLIKRYLGNEALRVRVYARAIAEYGEKYN